MLFIPLAGKSNCLGGGGKGGSSFDERKNRRFAPAGLLGGTRHPGAGFSLLKESNGGVGDYITTGNGGGSNTVMSQELRPLNSEDDESDTEEFVKPFHPTRT